MTPSKRYNQDLQQLGFYPDPAQAHAVASLQVLYDRLTASARHQPGMFARLLGKTNHIPGIYLVGNVGRGKTYLMDLFYECVTEVSKQRVHYHRFMLDIHEQLKHLPKSPDPLLIIGRNIARQTRLLCLDEFHVTDVADAMLLSGLLGTLFKHGVTLLATSNTPINQLYLNGLQRERFMRAITLLKDCTVEILLDSETDYRLLHLEKGQTFLVGDTQKLQDQLRQKFCALSPGQTEFNATISIHNRDIQTIALADDVVWFDFHALCDTPRAAKDYLEIARQFHTVLVSGIPQLVAASDSAAKRFMHLIDALYDHRVKLVASAAAEPEHLYQGKLLAGIFERTVSRLIEMASHDYLCTSHRI